MLALGIDPGTAICGYGLGNEAGSFPSITDPS